MSILKTLRPRYEAHHHVMISDEALEEAVRLSIRYLPDRFLPDKAIDLMDEAAARVRIRGRREPEELRQLEERHRQAEQELRQAVEQQNFERPPGSGTRRRAFALQCQEARQRWADSDQAQQLQVEPQDIGEVLSTWTGIPVSTLTQDRDPQAAASGTGSETAGGGPGGRVAALARAIQRSRSGLQEEDRPVGSFLSQAPPGWARRS